MIKTTVYSDGIISEGYYYDHRGIKTTVEYAGDKLGYGDMMLELRLGDNDITEVVHAVEHRINARIHVPLQANPLMTCWNTPV